MKKVIIALLIALIIPGCIFAGRGLFDLTVGAVASSDYTIGDVQDGALQTFDFGKLTFGADVEAKLAFLAVDAKAMYTPDTKTVSGFTSANLALDILIARAKVGIGYEYAYNLENNQYVLGNVNGFSSEFTDIKDVCLDVNVGVDVLLGNLTVGLYATLPTATSINNQKWGEMVSSATQNWDKAKIGATVGIALL